MKVALTVLMDGVVIYINEELKESTSIEIIKELAYINTCIFLKNDLKLNITSTYRSYGISKVDFIQTFIQIAEDYTNELLEAVLLRDLMQTKARV